MARKQAETLTEKVSRKYYWIKERRNPQLGVYYVACGQLEMKKADKMWDSLYGENIMHDFQTEDAYMRRIAELKLAGERFV